MTVNLFQLALAASHPDAEQDRRELVRELLYAIADDRGAGRVADLLTGAMLAYAAKAIADSGTIQDVANELFNPVVEPEAEPEEQDEPEEPEEPDLNRIVDQLADRVAMPSRRRIECDARLPRVLVNAATCAHSFRL